MPLRFSAAHPFETYDLRVMWSRLIFVAMYAAQGITQLLLLGEVQHSNNVPVGICP